LSPKLRRKIRTKKHNNDLKKKRNSKRRKELLKNIKKKLTKKDFEKEQIPIAPYILAPGRHSEKTACGTSRDPENPGSLPKSLKNPYPA
jgi:hypothetical protein